MIEYDYEIVRTDENTNEIEIFKPNKIPAKLPNLVSIEAPNSSGKSTLLSIIALSFFGNKNNKLHPSLVKQINSLLHSTRDNLIFKIKVTNRDSTIEIISEKKDGGKIDIIVHEISDGKKIILTPELLERKYNLIYDIPDNPTERLSKLTDEVKNSQMRYGNDVRALNGHIKNIILDIRNSKNPDRLKDLNQKHNDLLNETNDLDDLVKSFQNELDLLEFAVYDQFFNFYSMRYDFKNKELNKEKRKVKKVINAKTNSNNELRGKTIEIKNTLLNIQKIFDETTLFLKKLIPKKESHHLKIWELIDINQTVDTLEFDENLLQEISHFSSILNEMHADISNKSEYQEIKLYTDLINILDHYRTINVKIPGLEKPMNEFVDDLQEMVRSNQKEIIFDENCNQTIELLNNLRQEIKLAQLNILPDLKILRRLHSNDVQNDNYNDTIIESKIKDLNSDLKLYYDRMQYYQAELLKKGTYDPKTICEIGKGELEKYSVYTEEQLRNEIAALKDEITRDCRKSPATSNNFISSRFLNPHLS
jgi:exonuclease SbcC